MRVAVLGGGAAGFFAAIRAKECHPHAEVVILEKTQKILAKVKISGGGKCNVTNAEPSPARLAAAYPRGSKCLKKLFAIFGTRETMDWFESRGVPLITREDGHVFPQSMDSQSVIDCFLRDVKRLGISVLLGHGIRRMAVVHDAVKLHFDKDSHIDPLFDKVIIATGGSPKAEGLTWLRELGHKIAAPVPSLFTFNMPDESITQLMGVSVEHALVKIEGSKLNAAGPLLITHWGMSGPAVLRLSAFGARELADIHYVFNLRINWVGVKSDEEVVSQLEDIVAVSPKKRLTNVRPYGLPDRLWQFLLAKTEFSPFKTWEELGKSGLNKLTALLTNDVYAVKGKTTFKEEFVTCGGVSMDSIDGKTMRSKAVPQLYFAGEVMDIDGITGGYNFQAAWTTAFIAGQLG